MSIQLAEQAKAKFHSWTSQLDNWAGSYVSDNRRRQAQAWAMLYVNSVKCLALSTVRLKFLASAQDQRYAPISLFEYLLLWSSMIWLPVIAIYLITACFADYFGLTAAITNCIDESLKTYAFYGLCPSNAAAALYDPPKFLGYIKVNQNCETKEDGQKNLRIDDACLVDGTLHYKLHPKKAAAILGFNNVVPSSYVRSSRTITEDVQSEMITLKQQCLSKDKQLTFDKEVAKLMTRFCALSYEISKSSEDLEVENSLQFTLLEQFGFPSNVKCQVLFQDQRWPQTLAVAFFCLEDSWMTIAFKGTVAWNIEKQMLNICNDTITFKNGAKCHKIVWDQLCSDISGENPYQTICNELTNIFQANWPAESKPVLFLTGQGIGGSFAELFLYLKLTTEDQRQQLPLIGYTFGALGICDENFLADFNQRMQNFNVLSTLFTVHNSFDLFATLPIGLRSPGRHVSLFLTSDTPFARATDLMFWIYRQLKSFIYSEGSNIFDAIRGDKKALLSVVFWLCCNPPKPFCNRMPISYFQNLNDPDIRIVETRVPEIESS